MTKDAQSVTQEAREAAADLMERWQGESREGFVSGDYDAGFIVQAFARFQARLASQPTSAEDAVAWMRRCAFEKNEGTKGNRPKGWTMHPTTIAKLFDDDVALYTRPTPDAQTAAIGAEAMREALERAIQLLYDHVGGHGEIETLERALSQPVAAPQASDVTLRRAQIIVDIANKAQGASALETRPIPVDVLRAAAMVVNSLAFRQLGPDFFIAAPQAEIVGGEVEAYRQMRETLTQPQASPPPAQE